MSHSVANRWRAGLVALSICLGALFFNGSNVRADDPVPAPDAIGSTMSAPLAGTSVPSKPDGEPADPGKDAPTAEKAKYDAALKAYHDSKAYKEYAAKVQDPDTLSSSINALAAGNAKNYYGINMTWTLVAGFLVMFMQAGFALVETGLCRAKNAAHVMSMNFLVYALGMTGFFICGYALMCGAANKSFVGGPVAINLARTDQLAQGFTIPGGDLKDDKGEVVKDASGNVTKKDWVLFGTTGFFLNGSKYDHAVVVWFLFMMVFMDTTATIPTGALAERWSFKSFFIYSLFIGGLLYPIYGCWVWGGGWLAQLGKYSGLGHGTLDFAGSSVVHLQGGALALITAIMLGPRIGKFDSNGKPKALLGHNIPMVILGTFILAFGWFGFNAGSSLAGTDGRTGIVAVNTMLASAGGALASCIYMWVRFGKPDPSMMCNGMLAGLVAITAPCAFVAPWAGFLIGVISGVLVIWSVFFFEGLGIDDPVGAISVHGVNGAFGVLCIGIFSDGTYGDGVNGVSGNVVGFLYNAKLGMSQFWAQGIAVLACVGWNFIAGGVIFFIIGKVLGTNRVPPEVEIAGLDIPEMGAPGYPEYMEHMAPENVPASQISEAKAAIKQLATA